MAPLAEVGAFLGGLDGLGQPVGAHFLLPPAGERPALLGDRRATAERAARGGGAAAAAAAAADLAHLQGILRRRQLYCRTGFHLQILPDGSVRGTRQDHSLFGRRAARGRVRVLPVRVCASTGVCVCACPCACPCAPERMCVCAGARVAVLSGGRCGARRAGAGV